jgi:hypothetical protein
MRSPIAPPTAPEKDGPPPSGTTITGYFNLQMPLATGKKASAGVSFPVSLAGNQPSAVSFAPGSGATTTDPACTGNHNQPTAPAGKVCIYSKGSSGSTGFEALTVSPHGFALEMTASGGNPDFVGFTAVWAYTAP